MSAIECPLCHGLQCVSFCQDNRRQYFQCPQCLLVFANRQTLLTEGEELAQYRLHQNDVADLGYRRFLQRLATPLLNALPDKKNKGLDFGCGPGPLLALMLTEAGHDMAVWDPFFAKDDAVLLQQYDFICCSEAIEHFVNPAQEWQLWLSLLKPHGILAVMTKRYSNAATFANWHYKNDPTHVSFFSEHTFAYLARRDGFVLQVVDKDVVLLQRNH